MSASARAPREPQTYTLMDTAVILAVLATVLLLVAPTISASIRESRVSRAGIDCYRIATAVSRHVVQTGLLPVAVPGDRPRERLARAQVLVGPGRTPTEVTLTAWSTGRLEELRPDLIGAAAAPDAIRPEEQPRDGPSDSTPLPTDPWGRRYVLNVEPLSAGAAAVRAPDQSPMAVWVLSAGPNGIIETPFRQSTQTAQLVGDDIGVRIQ